LLCPHLVNIPCSFVDGYVPDGLTPEQWKKMKAAEEEKKRTTNYGTTGPKG